MTEAWTTLRLIRWTTEYFEKKGIPNPRLDAELLLANVLRCPRIELYTGYGKIVSEKHLVPFKSFIERRALREPLQYILGETEFWGLKIKVTPDVLIPRPETELLVEEAIKLNPRPCILDIGTGSGCIAIALAKNLPDARVIATEYSKEVFEVAVKNSHFHHLEKQIHFVLADIAPWRVFEAEGKKFDLIVSNPPYIASGEIENLQEEVRNFEPRKALDGGPDGLSIIRRILAEAPPFLKPGGHLLMEIGEDQSKSVTDLLAQQKKLRLKAIRQDYSGLGRILVAFHSSIL